MVSHLDDAHTRCAAVQIVDPRLAWESLHIRRQMFQEYPMATSSIRPAKLADAVADHIQELIIEGTLPPGESLLPDRDLAAKRDVSRPSLPEGLATPIPHGHPP